MPINPTVPERVAFAFNLAPVPMLDFFAALGFRATLAGLHLGVFDALLDQSRTTEELAAITNTEARGLQFLLEALTTLGYLTKTGERYQLTRMTRRWGAALQGGAGFAERLLFEGWCHLEDRLRGVRPAACTYTDKGRDWREFQGGMIAMARHTAVTMVDKVKLPPGAQRLIDVGGGHGLYAIEFCRRHPTLTATVFDLPDVADIAHETIANAGMGERVSFRGGDFFTDPLGEGYDVALVCNIVHSHQPPENQALLRRVTRAVSPGGVVAILEQLSDGAGRQGASQAISALMSLNLYNASGGQAYPLQAITDWLVGAGCGRPTVHAMSRSPGTKVLVSRRRA